MIHTVSGRSNLGEMEDETTEEKSQLRKQREEVAVLREHLSSQVRHSSDLDTRILVFVSSADFCQVELI